MYPLARLQGATDQLWTGVRGRLGWGPVSLEWATPAPEVWHHPDLLLAQTCGWPLVTELRDSVAVVGTFDYNVPDAVAGSYRTLIVTGTESSLDEVCADATSVAAVNSFASLSGWISLQHACSAVRDRESPLTIVTGSHLESCRALRSGRAQLASIDAVSWQLLTEWEPAEVAGLRAIGQGPRVPCLPIVVPNRHADEIGELRSAFAAAVADPTLADARRMLHIRGFVARDIADYLPLQSLAA